MIQDFWLWEQDPRSICGVKTTDRTLFLFLNKLEAAQNKDVKITRSIDLPLDISEARWPILNFRGVSSKIEQRTGSITSRTQDES